MIRGVESIMNIGIVLLLAEIMKAKNDKIIVIYSQNLVPLTKN
jgi:hypothetical protein